MNKVEQLYEGKAKKVFSTEDPNVVIVSYKDDATAFDGLKKGTITGKGAINNQMTNFLMQQLEKAGVPTHFVEELSERETVVKKVTIVPLEVIVRNISALLIMVISAFATTAGALISNQIGAGEQRCLFKTCGMTLKLTYAILIPLLIILCLFPEPVLRAFTDSPSLIAASVNSVYVMASSTLIMAPSFILFNAVSGTGNTKAGFIMEMISLAVYTAVIYYGIIRLKPDVALCWFSEHVYGVTLIILAWWYLKSGKWRGKKV